MTKEVFRPQQFWLPAGTSLAVHPAAEAYPMMEEDDLVAMTKDMKKNGYDPRYPIDLLGGEILEGRNRYKCALKANVPILVRNLPDDTDPEAYVQRANETRRHLTEDWRRKKRMERVARAAQARASGQSTRVIAEQEGVSQAQIVRDLEAARSTETGGTQCDPEPSNGKVTGKDGRQQKAHRTPLLCDGCTRNGAKEGCRKCKALRKEASAGRKEKTAEKKTEGSTFLDRHDQPIPKSRLDVWADPWTQQTFDYLAKLGEQFRACKFASSMAKRAKFFPFFNQEDFTAGVTMIDNTLDKLVQHLKDQRPAAVCPSCAGGGCGDCRHGGLVPEHVYKELKGRK